ncbi:LuxR family transcriptional regulator [Modestobacter sp. KNN46-3]|uniref:LuxR family transcriptional regulator n=1 Tax=Modestobacter sp. KNN46-3 TaxID=2711218 RepID=UPI001F14D3BD|nr:LuxR family transcriptional regulator [Modestobacter sp. KNN46-3]
MQTDRAPAACYLETVMSNDQRTVLVVDLDGEVLPPLQTLEQLLLSLGQWEDDDRLDPPDREPLRLPEPLADRQALVTVERLWGLLRPTQGLGAEHGRLLAPNGTTEHAPLSVITVPTADIEILSATARFLGNPGLPSDIADLVTDLARSLNTDPYSRGRDDRTEFVSQIARLAGLLDLEVTEDTHLLIRRIAANRPDRDLALTDEEEAAYQRTADRMNRLWGLGSGISRYLY